MMYGLSTLQLAGITVLIVAVTAAVAWWLRREKAAIKADIDAKVVPADTGEESDDDLVYAAVDLEPPEVHAGILGLIRLWRHKTKGARLAKKGYVRWVKLDARMNRPKWIKPDFRGTGEAEYYDKGDDVTYLFPREAMLTHWLTGAWTIQHRRNEADPLNLRDPVMPSIPADGLQRLINLMAEAEKPGFLSDLDLSMPQIMIGGGVIIFLVYAAYYVMNGGLG